ncbi:hypothetical protein DYB37_008112 [Aphanomyces astaci]|uniref:Uncharacterized protein n=1 Tax=Aphanomyces astaci TaxID=112090 RepID=A0A3R7E1L0_APHAT|nr:hypothetical protein DYB35_002984 [Aphanomyces astaci]RHZ28938.1 hypothetical protein DYB37_008112 [Aphanomyces astaci]
MKTPSNLRQNLRPHRYFNLQPQVARGNAERLRALDASLKAMEAEDDTGTLSKLKASLQHELESKSDDDGHYGSDFEEDFEEDAIAR